MIRTTLRKLVDRLLRRGKGAPSSPKAAPPRQPPPRPTPVTPRAPRPESHDHGHSHDHGGGGHDHGHDHGGGADDHDDDRSDRDHGHDHGGGGHDHGHDHGRTANVPAPAAPAPARPTVTVRSSETPNPNARKFTASCRVVERGTIAANSRADAERHPLAAAIWALDGVEGVFAVADFVTVTKSADAAWDTLAPAVEAALAQALAR